MPTTHDRRSPPTPPSAPPTRSRPPLRVLVTFPWRADRAAALKAELDPDCSLVDVHDDGAADVVVCPPCSEATLARVRAEFPGAAILVVEPADGVATAGLDAPVGRMLAAGASAYQVDPSPAAVASAIRRIHPVDAAAPGSRDAGPGLRRAG